MEFKLSASLQTSQGEKKKKTSWKLIIKTRLLSLMPTIYFMQVSIINSTVNKIERNIFRPLRNFLCTPYFQCAIYWNCLRNVSVQNEKFDTILTRCCFFVVVELINDAKNKNGRFQNSRNEHFCHHFSSLRWKI